MDIEMDNKVLLSVYVVVFFISSLYVYFVAWLRPERIRQKLTKQGIKGPRPSLFSGNISEMKKAVKKEVNTLKPTSHKYDPFPYFGQWRNDYGPVFMYSLGKRQALYVSKPEIVKDINLCVSLDLGKTTYLRNTHKPLFGDGIIKANGKSWEYQRKLIAPEFFPNKTKGMLHLMIESALPMLKSWESKIEQAGGKLNLKVDEDLRNYSADVISRACFGSSFSKGKEMFMKLRALQNILSTPNLHVDAGLRFLPTKENRQIWKLDREVRSLILEVVEEGKKSKDDHFLQAILKSASDGLTSLFAAENFIVDNCKNIYFAGHETTGIAAAWCLMLLGLHVEWQDRVRSEVTQICGDYEADVQSLSKMKTLTMVIQEALRLYPPGAFVTREAFVEMDLGGIRIPKGVFVNVLIPHLHHDPDIWGPDVHEFKPERFANGVLGACKHPYSYMPFGAGLRVCLGQNFAMVELKVILSLIVSKFRFSLSPSYHHSPVYKLLIQPEFGVDLVISKV